MNLADFKRKAIDFLKQYWATILFSVAGLTVTYDIANLVVLLQAIGIVSVILLFVSLILDDKPEQGLFPHYDEKGLILKASETSLGAAIVVAVKNLVVIVAIILAYLFVKP